MAGELEFDPLLSCSPDNFIEHLFSDPQRWCQGKLAKDAEGKAVHPCDSSAKSWCLDGALDLVNARFGKAVYHDKLNRLRLAILAQPEIAGFGLLLIRKYNTRFWPFNDNNPYEKVSALVRLAGV